MFDFSTLITDRTAFDVVQGTSKGFYNFEDLNRVEQAVAELNKTLSNAGYPIGATVKADWGKTDFPTENEMLRYLHNIQLLQDRFYSSEIATPISMKWLGFEGANNIEKILSNLEDMRKKMIEEYRFCGTINCGGDFL
ncbi:hypothetical protein [Anaerotignum sp.]|uniref:hypothetical protein n=1 Tax=Anaerotignum sp. TaxID=2039241 RepID=UPI0033333E0F